MNECSISKKWKKTGKLTALACDGTKVWIDVRGIVGLERPNGTYISLGASFADGSELHNSKFELQQTNKIIHIYDEKILYWAKDGYITGGKISPGIKKVLLEAIKLAMKSLGYSVKYIKVDS